MPKLKFEKADDIKARIGEIAEKIEFDHVDPDRLVCFRSNGSTARVYARIWELPRVWQQAFDVKPHYVIEVLSENFDKQSKDDQDKILIHELMHIPKTFSGALRGHNHPGHKIDHKTISAYFKKLKSNP